jgi:hypothetical protein
MKTKLLICHVPDIKITMSLTVRNFPEGFL